MIVGDIIELREWMISMRYHCTVLFLGSSNMYLCSALMI